MRKLNFFDTKYLMQKACQLDFLCGEPESGPYFVDLRKKTPEMRGTRGKKW
jgi:hypothetical protein